MQFDAMYRGGIEKGQSPKTSFTTKHLVWTDISPHV